MLLDVLHVTPGPEFQLELEYSNGERRRFDMRPLLSMKPWNSLNTPQRFAQAQVAYGTVVWPGDIDLAPETLYDDSTPIT